MFTRVSGADDDRDDDEVGANASHDVVAATAATTNADIIDLWKKSAMTHSPR
jgi:hypothetical protein